MTKTGLTQPLVISGAGTSDVNGTYFENGTENGKVKYEGSDYVLFWGGPYNTKWIIRPSVDSYKTYYTNEQEPDTPPYTGWETQWYAEDPAPALASATHYLTYDPLVFNEAESDDGSLDNSIDILYRASGNDAFSGDNGTFDAGKYAVTGLPSGLEAEISKTDDTTLVFSLTGNADAHAYADGISEGIELSFNDDAFTAGDASAVIYSTKSTISLKFNPFIETLADLKHLTETPADWGDDFVQTQDIDASATNGWDDGDGGDPEGFIPVGAGGWGAKPFTGNYDGRGYTIKGLFINRPGESYQGLFGATEGGTISNLGIIDADITASAYVGILAGSNGAAVTNCYSSGKVEGLNDNFANTGGLIGSNNHSISHVYNQADVKASSGPVGGIAGTNRYSSVVEIANAYNAGTVEGGTNVGGITGEFSNILTNCYNSGYVSGTDNTGALAGENRGTINNCYWDTQTSGAESEAGTGLTSQEMTQSSNFTGWTFDSQNWGISEGNSRPLLSFQTVKVNNEQPEGDDSQVTFPGGNIYNHAGHSIALTEWGYFYHKDTPETLSNSTRVQMATNTTLSSGENQAIAEKTLSLASGVYYATAYAQTSEEAWTGDAVRFVIGTPPTASTQSVSDIAAYSATGNGTIESLGAPTPHAHGFCWDTLPNPTIDNDTINLGAVSATGSFSGTLPGLIPARTYYVRAYVTNPKGTTYGEQVSFTTAGILSGGDGTAGNPYKIANLQDLKYLSDHPAIWGEHFIQTNDLTFQQSDFESGGDFYYEGKGFKPIGEYIDWNDQTPFTGQYDGDNHTITGLYINRPDRKSVSLFGLIEDATIRNTGTINVDITANGSVGGLTGQASGESTIKNCFVEGGTVEVGGYSGQAGGFIGNINGEKSLIHQCHATCAVSSPSTSTGGFVGTSIGTIENCYSTGNVSSESDYTGGFAGIQQSGLIKACHSTGDVEGQNGVGGFVGEALRADGKAGLILGCYSTGNVKDISASYNIGNAGGFVGKNDSEIKNCYSKGHVTRNSANTTLTTYGGFCGIIGDYEQGIIENCYALGDVIYESGTNPDNKGFTGAFGDASTQASDNFFDKDRSNQSTDALGSASPETTAAMQTQSTFTDAGWDFNTIWKIDETTNDGYPYIEFREAANTPGLWTGADPNDNNWNTPGNWDDGQVPGTGVNVTIPDTGNDPVISAAATCQNITIEANSILTINSSQTLNVSGNFTLNDDGGFTNNGTLKFSGNACELSDNRAEKSSLGNVTVGN